MRKYIFLLAIGLTAVLSSMAQTNKYSTNLSAYLHRPAQCKGQKVEAVRSGDGAETVFRCVLTVADDADALTALQTLGIDATRVCSGMLTASLPVSQLEDVAAIASIQSIELGAPVEPCMDAARAETGVARMHSELPEVNALGQAYTGRGVVVGFVDSGFEYGHAAFFDKDGNYRVKRVWNQMAGNGKAPAAFKYGTEYTTQAEILNATTDSRNGTHGTHVAGITTGSDFNSPYYGVAYDADIVIVATSQTSRSSYIIDGVKYIFDYATSVGKPCVVNLSLGSNYGPHDGTSACDRFLDEATGPGRIVVGSVGNDGDIPLHVSTTFTEENTKLQTFHGFYNPNNMQSLVDVWGDPGKEFTVRCGIMDNMRGKVLWQSDPISSSSTEVQTISYTNEMVSGAAGHFVVTPKAENSNGRQNIYIENYCTNLADNRRLALIVEGAPGTTVHAWNCTSNAFYSNNRAGWTKGDGYYTAGEIGGTSKSIISVGAYATRLEYKNLLGDTYSMPGMYKEGEIAYFSSRGPTLDQRQKPEVVAPGVMVASSVSKYYHSDRYAMIFNSVGHDNGLYYYFPETGTSMSSPFVAGVVACWLQANPTLTPDNVRDIISRTARRDTFTGAYTAPDNVSGFGKIDAYAGLADILGMAGISAPTVDAPLAPSAIYDLQGRTLSQPQNGIYILDGKVKIGR